MLLSRGASILKTTQQLSKQRNIAVNLKQIRNKWCYRTVPPREWKWEIISEITMGIAWWWVLYSFWHHSELVFGEFDYPVPDDWTDEELGIPKDD